jgi:hypothetical protein
MATTHIAVSLIVNYSVGRRMEFETACRNWVPESEVRDRIASGRGMVNCILCAKAMQRADSTQAYLAADTLGRSADSLEHNDDVRGNPTTERYLHHILDLARRNAISWAVEAESKARAEHIEAINSASAAAAQVAQCDVGRQRHLADYAEWTKRMKR